MNSISEDVKDILEMESLGLELGVDLFVAREPSSPDNCVTIFDTPGGSTPLTYDKTEQYRYESIQIRVRNESYLTAYALAEDIRTVLHGLAQETWNGTVYSLIQCTQGPALLDWDNNNRCRVIINFNVQRR